VESSSQQGVDQIRRSPVLLRSMRSAGQDQQLAAPGVESKIRESSFSIRGPELGFAQAPTTLHKQITLTNMTVRQICDSVARSLRPRVWVFEETAYNKQDSSSPMGGEVTQT